MACARFERRVIAAALHRHQRLRHRRRRLQPRCARDAAARAGAAAAASASPSPAADDHDATASSAARSSSRRPHPARSLLQRALSAARSSRPAGSVAHHHRSFGVRRRAVVGGGGVGGAHQPAVVVGGKERKGDGLILYIFDGCGGASLRAPPRRARRRRRGRGGGARRAAGSEEGRERVAQWTGRARWKASASRRSDERTLRPGGSNARLWMGERSARSESTSGRPGGRRLALLGDRLDRRGVGVVVGALLAVARPRRRPWRSSSAVISDGSRLALQRSHEHHRVAAEHCELLRRRCADAGAEAVGAEDGEELAPEPPNRRSGRGGRRRRAPGGRGRAPSAALSGGRAQRVGRVGAHFVGRARRRRRSGALRIELCRREPLRRRRSAA